MSPRRRWSPRLLYLGVFLFALLVALAALSIRREWRERIGQGRADAIFQLVQGRTPARPIETPGASAWLNLELRRYRARIADPDKARLYGEVAEWRDDRSVPPFFAPIRDLLASPLTPAESSAAPALLPPAALDPPAAGAERFSFRTQEYVEADGRWLVVTRRRMLEPAGSANRSERAPSRGRGPGTGGRVLRRPPHPRAARRALRLGPPLRTDSLHVPRHLARTGERAGGPAPGGLNGW